MIVFHVDHKPTLVTIAGRHHLVRYHHPAGSASTWCGKWTSQPEHSPRAETVCWECRTAHSDHQETTLLS